MNDNWLKYGKTGHDLVCEAKEVQLLNAVATVAGNSGQLTCNQGEMVTSTLCRCVLLIVVVVVAAFVLPTLISSMIVVVPILFALAVQ